MKVTVIDTETTGLTKDTGKLIEVAIATFDLQVCDVIACSSQLIKGATEAEVKNTEYLHGISYEFLNQYGTDDYDGLSTALQYAMVDSTAILAHNAEFDRQWFAADFPTDEIPWVCTCDDFVWPNKTESKSLTSIALAHGVGVLSAHRAMADVMTLCALLKRVGDDFGSAYLIEQVTRGMRPKAKFLACVTFSQKDLVKAAGFRWDADKKIWWRQMAIDDAKNLPFPTKIIYENSQTSLL